MSQVAASLPIRSELNVQQATALDRLVAYLSNKTAEDSRLLHFLQTNHFTVEMAQKAVGQLKSAFPQMITAAAPANQANAQRDLINRYFTAIYKRFQNDRLFFYELEAYGRNRDTAEFRFGNFLDQLPFFIELENPSHASLLLNAKVRALFGQQYTKLFIEPFRKVFWNPGRLPFRKFALITELRGQPLLELTSQLENDGWASTDLRRDEFMFQVKKIQISRSSFKQYLELLRSSLPKGDETIALILRTYDSTVSIPAGQPAYEAYQRISTKSITFSHFDLSFLTKESIAPENLHLVYYEALCLLNYFKRTDLAKAGNAVEPMVQYADRLTTVVRAFVEKAQLNAFQSAQVVRIFGALSMVQGKSLMMINEFYRGKNALEYDQFVSILKKAYV